MRVRAFSKKTNKKLKNIHKDSGYNYNYSITDKLRHQDAGSSELMANLMSTTNKE